MDPNVLDLLRSRRTVRRFTPEPVPAEDLEALLEGAMYAPSRLNRQPWHFVIVNDPVVKNRAAELLRVHPYLEEAPVLVLVYAQPTASPTWLMDVSAATQNMLLAASGLGLGSAWVSSPDSPMWGALERDLRPRLHAPEDVRLAAIVAIGHPAEAPTPHERVDRFDPLKIHEEVWERTNLMHREHSA